MAETRRKRPPSFKLEIPANEVKKNELLQNLQKVREVLVKQLGRPVNNTDIMDALVMPGESQTMRMNWNIQRPQEPTSM